MSRFRRPTKLDRFRVAKVFSKMLWNWRVRVSEVRKMLPPFSAADDDNDNNFDIIEIKGEWNTIDLYVFRAAQRGCAFCRILEPI